MPELGEAFGPVGAGEELNLTGRVAKGGEGDLAHLPP